jgi:protein TonB
MFDHLVESQTDTEDLKRKGAFLGITLAIYGVLLVAALIASIIAVDAHLDSQNLELETLVAPVPLPPQEVKQEQKQEVKKTTDQDVDVREQLIADMDRPDLKVDKVSTDEQKIPPVRKGVTTILGERSSDAAAPVAGPAGPGGDGGGGSTVNQSTNIVKDDDEPPPPKPTPKPPPKTISGGVLNGKAVSLPKPAYPQIARAAKASGTVVVQVTIDESGRVVSASAISGHPLLKAAAVQAAYGARFSPTLLSGQPVKVTGTINYNFMGQ